MQVEHNATTPLFIAIVYSTKQSKMSDVGASSESDDEEDVKLAGDIISSGLDHEEKVATTAVTAKNTEGYGSKASPKGRRKGTSADDRWEDMYNRLLQYKAEHGHCHVPNRYEPDPKLGAWVSTQRRHYRIAEAKNAVSNSLPDDRIKKLEEAGFEWTGQNPRHLQWNVRYQELKKFKEETGHTQVPIGWKENVRLANWTSTQRQEYKNLKQGKPTTLDERRVKLLNDIGFVWSVQRGGKRKAPSSSGNEHREPDSFQDDERTVRPGNDQKKGTESANNNDDTSITQAVAAQEQPRKTVQRSSTRETKRQKIDEVVARGEDTIGSTQISNTPATSIQSPVYSLPQSTSLPIGFPSLGQGQSATFTSDITADLASLQNNRFLSRQSSLPSLSSHHATAQLQSLLSGVTSQASQSSLPFYSGGVGRISNSENELNQVLASFHRRQQPQRLQLPHNSNLPLVLALERQLGPVSGSSPVSRTFEISNNSLLELQMQYQRVLGRQPYHYHRALGQGDTRLQNDPLAFLYLNRSGTGREAASNLASSELLNLARRERSNSNAPYILPPFPGVPRTFGEQGDNELADDSKTSDSDLVPGR